MRTAIYLAVLVALALTLGVLTVGLVPALLLVTASMLVSIAAYWGRSQLLLRKLGGRPLSRWEAWDLYALTDHLAARAGLPTPRLYLLPARQANALSVATARESAIGVTTELMEQFPVHELAAIIAHELAHIKNRDVWIALVASGLAGVAVLFVQLLVWSLSLASALGVPGFLGAPLLAFPAALLFPIVILALRMAISREREFLADKTAARLVGDPGLLADALCRLEQVNRTPWWLRWLGLAPRHEQGDWLTRLLSSHPPTSERLARLERLQSRSGLVFRHQRRRPGFVSSGSTPWFRIVVWRW